MSLVSRLDCVSNSTGLYFLFNYSFLNQAARCASVSIDSGGTSYLA